MSRPKQELSGALDPIMYQLFNEQDRINMPSADLEARTGITAHAISAIRRGRRQITVNEASLIAEALKFKLVLREK